MPKYDAIIHFSMICTFDTIDFPDNFAQSKDDLADKRDPNDKDAVVEWVQDELEGDTFFFEVEPEITSVAVSRVDN